MTQVLAVLLFAILAFSSLFAQQTPAANSASPIQPKTSAQDAPATTKPQQPSGKDTAQAGPAQAPTPPDYSQQAYVVEHFRESMRFENDGTGMMQTEGQIRIVSESGVQALGQLRWGYSALSDKLEIGYVRVRKPDGSVITAQESAIQDLTFPDAPVYTDYHEKHISVPSLRPGDVLEYRFVRNVVTPLTPGQFWMAFNFADKGIILDEQLDINVPKDRQIELKFKPGLEPKVSDEGDRRTYHWTYTRLQDEDEGKDKKKKAKKSDDDIPSVQLTTYKSWQELGAWYGQLERDRRVPDDSVKAQAATLVKGKGDDMAKVKALYEYVSSNIRYVSLSFGLGRFQPHSASEVLANGYGDCKDKNTLLAALLEAQGFHSTSVLINSRVKLDPEVPSPSQFDHVITRVPVGGKDIWLDSTPGVAPFRMLSSGLRGKEALAIPPTANAELVWTPKDLPFEGYDRSQLTGELNDTGKLTAHMTMMGRGDSEMVLRFAMRRLPSNRWKDIFDYTLQHSRLRGAELTNLKATDPNNTEEPLQVDFDLTANNIFEWSAAETKFPMPLSVLALPDEDDDDSDSNAEPIKLGGTQEFSEQQKLKFPSKYKVHPPIGVDVKRDYAEYHSVYKFDGGELTSTRTLRMTVDEIPRSRAADYEAFRRVVLADQSQQASIENTQPGTGSSGANESAADLFDAAVQAMRNQHYAMAVDLLQRVVKLEPKHKDAWYNLGNAYMATGQTEQAIAAFKKQIENNAYDGFAYNGLGLAYERQSKFDEAIQQFRKQIEVNPLDQYAHANLGRLFVVQKKYAEAVPELEKAVDLQPQNALIQIQLGQAYIGANQTEKGMAAFEKAISISPTPLVWNNIAYSLSEQNVQLERASQYADTAINALQTRLRDVSLDNLHLVDLGTMELLFSAWDTKGWIEFQRGNTDIAEQYISDAWQAGGSGDEAEHLGEIAEKRGQRDKAIRYYLLSMAGERPAFQSRARLEALGVKDIDVQVAKVRPELQSDRTVPLSTHGKGTAEFYLLIAPGKVEDAKFIKGDESLKTLAPLLPKANITMKFPPKADAHVVRRAVVRCGTTSPGPCSLELIPSSQVRTLE